ncbi:hypothetical protein Gorai_022102 [Gossypium raimondii]|uniref:RNase H type-1 domain-containing protein n=1 Tax=Gossypium raimondii TaxID=29730 RepID=A0A7J8NSA0_GOSRA|nr:hypothetical protein [Gossypium raimondii]
MAFKFEARAVLEGLRLAWEKRSTQVKFECYNALKWNLYWQMKLLTVRWLSHVYYIVS